MSKTKSTWVSSPMRLVPVLVCLVAGCSPAPITDSVTDPDVESATFAPPSPAKTTASAPGNVTSSVSSPPPRLAVEGEGLRWFLQPSGSARSIPFGRPQAQVMASLEAVRGFAAKGTNQDCGAGPLQYATWRDGLSLVFQDKRFVGWSLNKSAADVIATAAGIGPGTTRAELESAYAVTVSKTSLGYEFSAGDVHGVIDGASAGARITDMWAGVSCVAR